MSFNINLIANVILNQYFQNANCLLIFQDSNSRFKYGGSLPVVIFTLNDSTINENNVFRNYGCQGILLQHENYAQVLNDIEKKIILSNNRFNQRRYLILPPSVDHKINPDDFFQLPIIENIVHILLLRKTRLIGNSCVQKFKLCNNEEIFDLITNQYVGKNGDKTVLLDKWFTSNKTFANNANLYPNKISNQQGKTLKVASFTYVPYAIIEDPLEKTSGTETNIVKNFVKKLNMTIEIVYDGHDWGIIYDNWTGNGILGILATGQADIGYSSVYSWEHEYNYMDFSKPTVLSGVTCLVPAPKLASGWLTPILPFSTQLWAASAISFGLIFFLYFSINYVYVKEYSETPPMSKVYIIHESFFTITTLFLLQSVSTSNNKLEKSAKYLGLPFLLALILSSLYSSGLASNMTIPRYENPIYTVEDLYKSGIEWGGTSNAWTFSIIEDTREEYKSLMKRFVWGNDEFLRAKGKLNNFGFPIERLPSGHYAMGEYINDQVQNLRLMRDDIYWEYCIIMLRKSSPLLEPLNELILQANEAGLPLIWETMAVEAHMNMQVQNIVSYYKRNQEGSDNDVVKIEISHILGVFGIWVFGHLLAILCFWLELLIHKCNKL